MHPCRMYAQHSTPVACSTHSPNQLYTRTHLALHPSKCVTSPRPLSGTLATMPNPVQAARRLQACPSGKLSTPLCCFATVQCHSISAVGHTGFFIRCDTTSSSFQASPGWAAVQHCSPSLPVYGASRDAHRASFRLYAAAAASGARQRKPEWVRILEEDAEFDEDVEKVLKGANGNPDKIRENMRAELQKRSVLPEREGVEQLPAVAFREVNPFGLWIWVHFVKEPNQQDQDLLDSVLKSWFTVGKLGGYNGQNLQMYHNASDDQSFFDYENDDLDDSMSSFLHDMGDMEYRQDWGRVCIDLGTCDELAIDMLLNMLLGFSKEFCGLRAIYVGGENDDWPVPEVEEEEDDEVNIDPMRLPEGLDQELEFLDEVEEERKLDRLQAQLYLQSGKADKTSQISSSSGSSGSSSSGGSGFDEDSGGGYRSDLENAKSVEEQDEIIIASSRGGGRSSSRSNRGNGARGRLASGELLGPRGGSDEDWENLLRDASDDGIEEFADVGVSGSAADSYSSGRSYASGSYGGASSSSSEPNGSSGGKSGSRGFSEAFLRGAGGAATVSNGVRKRSGRRKAEASSAPAEEASRASARDADGLEGLDLNGLDLDRDVFGDLGFPAGEGGENVHEAAAVEKLVKDMEVSRQPGMRTYSRTEFAKQFRLRQ